MEPERYKTASDIIEKLKWQNARVERTELGYEDHGVLTVCVHCAGESWGQGFGGRFLTGPNTLRHFVEGVLAATGCDNWEKVAGVIIRVGRESDYGEPIIALRPTIKTGPIFMPGDDLDKNPGLYK